MKSIPESVDERGIDASNSRKPSIPLSWTISGILFMYPNIKDFMKDMSTTNIINLYLL